MRLLPCLATLALSAVPVLAQETYWVANRASNDIMQVTAWGSVVRRIDMGTSLRSAHVAPDGKVWVVRFIQPTFDIVDPVTATITPVASTLGSPYDIAFDSQGTAWVSGGSGVQQFDANGNQIQAIPLAQAAPLGITIDALGNKWIAHRTTVGSVSRIDSTNVVTNFPVTGGNPVRPIADFRGLLMPSHIWVTCDNGGALLELDDMGNELHNYTLPSASIGGVGPVFDSNGDIWVGTFAGGSLYQIDENSGIVLNTYTLSPNILGLSVDSLGRILAAQRVTFSGVGPPCTVARVDPASGTVEMLTTLEIGGFAASGTQAAVSTPYQYSLVVAPVGDLDGDGDVNFAEIQGMRSPIDATSDSLFTVDSTGPTGVGNVAAINIRQSVPALWAVGFAGGLLPAGIPVPGFDGILLLDITTLILINAGVGSASLPLSIPATTAVGSEVLLQGALYTGTTFEFRNVSGVLVW